MKKITIFFVFVFLFSSLFNTFASEGREVNLYSNDRSEWLNLISVRKNQKKAKPNPKEEREIEDIEQKLDFLDNVLDEVEKDLNQIEQQHDSNKENQGSFTNENQSSNQ